MSFIHRARPIENSTLLQKRNMALYQCLSVLVIVIIVADSVPLPDTSTMSLGMLLKKTAEKQKAGIVCF